MRVVLCNCPPRSAAEIANVLVSEGLAACVNIISGVESVYRWKGVIETDRESTLLIKTSVANIERLRERVIEIHPYETVEFLSLDVVVDESEPTYVDWVRSVSNPLNSEVKGA